ncbi:NfeD family protein [bacterium]|nr:NfeD family protein [bacterium]
MKLEYWLVWTILAVVFLLFEMLTAGFFAFWFGIGALIALITYFLHVPIMWQWVTFIVFSSVGAIFSRKFANKISKKVPEFLANEDVLNHEGKVVDELKEKENTVMGKFKGELWRCVPEDDIELKLGDRIKPIKIDGTHLIVKRIEN